MLLLAWCENGEVYRLGEEVRGLLVALNQDTLHGEHFQPAALRALRRIGYLTAVSDGLS